MPKKYRRPIFISLGLSIFALVTSLYFVVYSSASYIPRNMEDTKVYLSDLASNRSVCEYLDQTLLKENIHFYWEGERKKFVTMGDLLEQTNCLFCNVVCQGLLQEKNEHVEVRDNRYGDSSWKRELLLEMSGVIQKQLSSLQHPTDCSSVKKLVCSLFSNNRGFGSQIHGMAYCLLLAYVTKRTFIMNTGRFRYGKNAWEENLIQISNCSMKDVNEITLYSNISNFDEILNSSDESISVPDVKAWVYHIPDFLFLAIPEDLAFSLTILNDDPPSWWIGQFIKYLFKLQPEIEKIVQREIQFNFNGLAVGMQIRRTDSVRSGLYRPVAHYMSHVVQYFDSKISSPESNQRRVFVASDDKSVFRELEDEYPSYTFIYNSTIAEKAIKRHNTLFGIIHDLYLLNHCDFVVCTLSSNVGRTIYELMQAKGVNVTEKFKSLDMMYFLSKKYQQRHIYRAIEAQVPSSAKYMSMSVGHIVERVFSNPRKDAYYGQNSETHEEGYFAISKVRRVWPLTKHPSFERHSGL